MKKDIYSDNKYRLWLKNAHPKTQDWFKKENEYLIESLEPGSKILDVGCGFGRHMLALAGISKEVFGVDNSKDQIIRAKKYLSKFDNAFLSVQSVENLKFEDNTFDYIICMTNTFGNLLDLKEGALKEMKRVCKKEGKIIISVYNDRALNIRKEDYKKAGVHIKKVEGGKIYIKEGLITEQFTKERLTGLFNRLDLKYKIIALNEISFLCELKK